VELVGAFSARLPVELRDTGAHAEVERELEAVVARARGSSGVELDVLAFVGYLAERVTFDTKGHPVLRTVNAGDLWIAFGCVTSHPGALSAFEVRYGGEISNTLRRSFEVALAEDAELKLRNKLFLVGEDESPRLASYAGRGALGPWLRAAAIRTAIDVMRARREVPSDPAVLDLATIDPLLAGLKQRYREEFHVANRFDQPDREHN
jgi:RNA polymerase sigma-70 factor (ECF subfamily)